MNKDECDKLPVIQANSEDLIMIDETNSIRDTTRRPLQGADRERAEKYWADMKKYSPQEFEELMKRRPTES
jgi:hypothetical protein